LNFFRKTLVIIPSDMICNKIANHNIGLIL
jgi:hypothetical protein